MDIGQYFEEYRNKLETLNSIKKEHNQLVEESKQQIAELYSKYEKTYNEINNMRRVITLIVDQGLDPVEAKLKVDNLDNAHIWNGIEIAGCDKLQCLILDQST